MKIAMALLLSFCSLTGYAAYNDGIAPDLSEQVIAANLKGILILGDWNLVRREPIDSIAGVEAIDAPFLLKNRSFLEKIQAKYIGKAFDQRSLWELKNEIADFYRSQNQLFTVVTIPRQNMTKGVIQLVVEETRLGEVRCKGNKYYSGSELMGFIRTKSGDVIVEKEIVEDLAWMNKNPFRRTDAVYVPGKAPGTADLELVTIDRWPYRIYAGADNTGTIATSRDRFFFGFNFGKTILPDSEVSYQFTFSPNWNRFYAHTLSAKVPCPWRHEFILWGGYSQIEPMLSVHNQKETGRSWQVDVRYRIPITDFTDLLQTLVIGYDFKETHAKIKEDHSTIFRATADINQFMLGYEVGWKDKCLRVTFVGEAYANPGGITDKNKTHEYEKFRFEAASQYAYMKIAHSLALKFGGGWWFSYDLTGQISSKNLLPSEQFSLSGYQGVRGFEERIALADNAAVLSASVETPHWSPGKSWGASKRVDELYFLVFWDSAIGGCHQRSPGERKLKTLGSIGPGVRYQFSRYVNARFDYGIQLWHRGFFNPSHSRYNFGLIVSY